MTMLDPAAPVQPDTGVSGHAAMIWTPDGTFRMGSDQHYAEEAHVTFAEVVPDASYYPYPAP
jgi:hypothetical protein